MEIAIPCEYLSMEEVAARWRLKPGSWDLHRAILGRYLSPCILLVGAALPMSRQEDGRFVPDGEPDHFASGWLYPCHGQQTNTWEAVYPVLSDRPEGTEGARFWALPHDVVNLSSVVAHGVVMAKDLERAEASLRPQSGDYTTKEENSMLRLLRVVLWAAYKQNPLEKSDLVSNVIEDAKAQGIKIAPGTVRKYAREAFTNFGEGLKAVPAQPMSNAENTPAGEGQIAA